MSVTPRRVLFVDDEESILQGLSRTLRPLRFEMSCEFCSNGKEALARMAKEPFDVVVADMRMPGMDGAALLAEVQKRHPHLIRIIFSGHPEFESALRALSIAHQFIAKPCEAEKLRSVISRAIELRNLLSDRALRTVVAGIRELPARPETYLKLNGVLADPHAGTPEIAKVIGHDAVLCAKLLRVVNSSFFNLPRRINSIEQAVRYVGSSMLRSIALATGTNETLAPRARKIGYDMDAAQRQSLLAAQLATQFLDNRVAGEDAFTAALLQDIGEILLIVESSEDLANVIAHARARAITLDEAELELGVVSHAHVGAYLLGAWGLPYSVVEAVAHHHNPQAVPHEHIDIVDAVYAGTMFAQGYLSNQPEIVAVATRYIEHFVSPEVIAKASAAAERFQQGDQLAPG